MLVSSRKDLGPIPLRLSFLSFLFKKVVICEHCLVSMTDGFVPDS